MKLKGKYLPDLQKKSDLRKDDEKQMLKVMSTLTKKMITCTADPCDKEASIIVDKFPLCAAHGIDYLRIHKKNSTLT
jgi:hypothetical protein